MRASALTPCLPALVLLLVGCGGDPATSNTLPTPSPAGGDVVTPYPIAHLAGGPATYKGLPLSLAAAPAPSVTPVKGVIGVVCVGMSNGSQECAEWIQQVADAWRSEVNPAVRIVNCAVGGHAIERWIDPAFDDVLWDDCVTRRLPQAGVLPAQVRVIYHKAANQFGLGPGGTALPLLPAAGNNSERLRTHLGAFAARVQNKFPSVQAVYTSSRSYGGFTTRADRGEPQSYEEGHALNTWLAANPSLDGVWYGWGAYLWAPACASGIRNAANVCYDRGDYQDDAVHPAPSGRLKIARMMHDRLRAHAWYRP